MIKFVLVVVFMNFILIKNKIIVFYYNICYFLRLVLICIYIYKEILVNIIFKFLGLDYYSIWLLIIRFWIIGLIFISLQELEEKIKIIIFISLLIVLIMFFISLDLIMFYFIFEVRLIPTFILIVYWGGNPERLISSYYLIIYMLLISFPLLLYIFNLYLSRFTLKFVLIKILVEGVIFRFGGFLMIFIALYIKIPIYLIHIWLPKAHVEAPVYGSIILAGVLLKIGRYGLIRFLEIFIKISLKFNYLIIRVGAIGGVLIRLVCIIQVDIKRLVAYSSVVHINIILCRMLTLFKIGFLRRYIIIISHGLCSSGLFYIVNLYYERTFRRLLIINKGMIGKIPRLRILWFILCIINFSFPFSLGFFREILIIRVVLNWDLMIIIILMIVCFFRRAYSLYLFSYVQHGAGTYVRSNYYNLGVIKEFLVVLLHVLPLILILFNLLIFIYLSSLRRKY